MSRPSHLVHAGRQAQPDGANPSEWRAACALRTLAEIPQSHIGKILLNGLVEDSLARPISADDRLKILAEAALLAGLIQAPSYLSPYRHPERALDRRNLVLEAMVETNAMCPHMNKPRKRPLALWTKSSLAGQ